MSEKKRPSGWDKAAKISPFLGGCAVCMLPAVLTVRMLLYYDVLMYLPVIVDLVLCMIPMFLAISALVLGWRGLKSNARTWAIGGLVMGGGLLAFLVVFLAWLDAVIYLL